MPLIVHVVYHLAVGGLGNGLVNLINRIPEDRYRHAIVCMTDYTDFRNRIQNQNVDVHVLNNRLGKDLKIYNALEAVAPAFQADGAALHRAFT